MKKSKSPEVYYDGDCPMCRVVVGSLETQKDGSLDTKNFREGYKPDGISEDDLEHEIHVVDEGGVIYRNIDAILQILPHSMFWDTVRFLARLPGVYQMLQLGYRFVARNRMIFFGPSAREYWVRATITLFLLIGILSSLHLWVGYRFFPHIPVFTFLDTVPVIVEYILLGVLFVAFLLSLDMQGRRWMSLGLVTLGILVILDQSRLQPWVIHYALLLIPFAYTLWNTRKKYIDDSVVRIIAVLLSLIYIWSGVHKINPGFTENILPFFLGAIAGSNHVSSEGLMNILGYIIPYMEILIGVGLLVRRTRKIALGGAIIMHIGILLVLIFGAHYNSVVWPWNLGMMILVILVFTDKKLGSFWQVIFGNTRSSSYAIGLLFLGILPYVGIFGWYDSYPSVFLYTGAIDQGVIMVQSDILRKLPKPVQEISVASSNDYHAISIQRWSLHEMNVPDYPEERIFRSIHDSVCQYSENMGDIILHTRGRPYLPYNPKPGVSIDCRDRDME